MQVAPEADPRRLAARREQESYWSVCRSRGTLWRLLEHRGQPGAPFVLGQHLEAEDLVGQAALEGLPVDLRGRHDQSARQSR